MFQSNLLELPNLQLSNQALQSLLAHADTHFIFIKNLHSIYQYNNKSFARLMGLQATKNLNGYQDAELTRDKSKINTYLQHHLEVLDTNMPLQVSAAVCPKHNTHINKWVSGTMYPVWKTDTEQAVGVLAIMHINNEIFPLTLDIMMSISLQELDENLVKRSYLIQIDSRTIMLSKREVQCLIATLQGFHAGEIAAQLLLKQSTVEFYIENLKTKLGESKKSALIQLTLNHQIIQQLIL